MGKQMLRIERRITVINLVPIDGDHYPSMTPEEARNAELELEGVDMLENFVEGLQSADFESAGDEVENYPIGSATQTVEIIDMDNWPKK